MKNRILVSILLSALLSLVGCTNNEPINDDNHQQEQNNNNDNNNNNNDDNNPPDDDGGDDDSGEEIVIKTILDNFYDDIKGKNFTVTSSTKKEMFYGEYGYSEEIFGVDDFAILPVTNKGIFEAHKLESGDYEIHGMLSPNIGLKDEYHKFSNNFMGMEAIEKKSWRSLSNGAKFQLFNNEKTLKSLVGVGMFEDEENIETIFLENGSVSKYVLTVKYFSDALKDDEKISITDVGTTENIKVKELGEKEPVALTAWTDYQLRGMQEYGFTDIPFFSTFTTGVQLVFDYFVINGTAVTVFEIYDYLGKKEDEETIAGELEDLYNYEPYHHQTEGMYSYYKSYLDEIDLLVTFRYVNKNELSGDNQRAFPYGYIQMAFAYVPAEHDLTMDGLSDLCAQTGLPELILDSERINRIYKIEYKSIYNQIFMEDEDYITSCQELGYEVGPMYESYFSLFIEAKDKETDYDYIVDLLDDFRSNLKLNGYVIRQECEGYDQFSLDAIPNGTISYDKFDNELVAGGIDIYLNGSDGELDEFTGTIEIVCELFTELGSLFLS